MGRNAAPCLIIVAEHERHFQPDNHRGPERSGQSGVPALAANPCEQSSTGRLPVRYLMRLLISGP